jgi:Ran GTPase-activating protein (RanGAP) involved in mRNA processing and transport
MGLTAESTFIFQMMIASDSFSIMYIDISLNSITDDGFENILLAIRANPNKKVRVLLADNVGLGPESAVRISHYLKVTVARPTVLPLIVLSLANNGVGNIGVETLVSFLKGQSLMRYLDLSYNRLSDKGLYGIADMLRTNSSLNIVYLEGNT